MYGSVDAVNSKTTSSISALGEEAGDFGPPRVFRKRPHLQSGIGLLANIVEAYVLVVRIMACALLVLMLS